MPTGSPPPPSSSRSAASRPSPAARSNAPLVLTSTYHADGDGRLRPRRATRPGRRSRRRSAPSRAATRSCFASGHGGRRRGPVAACPHGGTVVAPDARLQRHRRPCSRDREADGSVTRAPGRRRRHRRPSLAALDGADLLWLESPTNPLLEVADLPTLLAAGPRARRALASSTTPSPRPCCSGRSTLGADVVVHSVTKYLSGHTDVVLGAVVTPTTEPAAPTTSGCCATAPCTARSPGRWRSGSRCAGCARCTCGSSAPGANAARARRAGCATHPAVERVRYPGFGGDRRRSRSPAAPRPPSGSCAATRLWVHATSLGGVESPAGAAPAHPERAADGAGEPGAAVGRHRGRRRPLARPQPGPRPGLTEPGCGQRGLGLAGPGQQRRHDLRGGAVVLDHRDDLLDDRHVDAVCRGPGRGSTSHDFTPSAVCLVTATTSASAHPLAEAARRRCGCATAATCRWRRGRRRPASPAKVAGSAPSAAPSRVVSASPRVMIDALELSPMPMPSAMPTASAMTFFTAPPSSVPDDVGVGVGAEVRRRRRPPRRSSAIASSAQATTLAAGCLHGDLAGEVRPGHDDDALRLDPADLGDDLAHPLGGAELDALHQRHDRRRGGSAEPHAVEVGAQRLRRARRARRCRRPSAASAGSVVARIVLGQRAARAGSRG